MSNITVCDLFSPGVPDQ